LDVVLTRQSDGTVLWKGSRMEAIEDFSVNRDTVVPSSSQFQQGTLNFSDLSDLTDIQLAETEKHAAIERIVRSLARDVHDRILDDFCWRAAAPGWTQLARDNAATCLLSRPIRRAAAFLCRTPFEAALLSSLMASLSSVPAAVASLLPTASRTLRTSLRTLDRTVRLRSRRFSFCRFRLIADACRLATGVPPGWKPYSYHALPGQAT
jgi:hypothetical protein